MILVQKMAASLLVLVLPFFNNTQASPSEALRESSGEASVTKFINQEQTFLENYYGGVFHEMGITLRPGSFHRTDNKPTAKSARRCKSIVYKTLLELPEAHRDQLRELTLFYTNDGRRGLGGNSAIVLRCLNVTDEELSSVLTHEIGHLVDGSLLTGGNGTDHSGFFDFGMEVPTDDLSVLFYQLSWKNELAVKSDATELDFVSGYAMTDPFEDFAETYAYYRLHGAAFRELFESSVVLREKYEFMKRYVFEDEEFGTSNTTTVAVTGLTARPYDVTVLPFSE